MPKLTGNTQGLSSSQIQKLERVLRKKVPSNEVYSHELIRTISEISHASGRQIGALIDRNGTLHSLTVGDATKIFLPDVGRLRASEGRLRGLRLIHTHLHNEPLSRDDIVDLTRLRLDLIVAICLSQEGEPRWVHHAYNIPTQPNSKSVPYKTFGPDPYSLFELNPLELVSALEDEFSKNRKSRASKAKDGRAILVHVCEKRSSHQSQKAIDELSELANTAGVEVADTLIQIRDRIDPKYVLGKGKIEDLIIRSMQLDIEVLIFDRNLSPTQAASIASLTELKVIDRSQLILDIFAQRAESKDGKLQVELAQMKYLLPRLGTKDDALSRLTGGIGGRGPGETKLEIGKRRARERINRLQKELKNLKKQRINRRGKRRKGSIPIVAIVGYTNAGKSTLLNTLTHSQVLAEDKLFATLDTRTKLLHLPLGHQILLTDTVGFIRELPIDLFAAFQATFEETADADLIIQLVDSSDESKKDHIQTTNEVLHQLELHHIPKIVVYNKSDLLTEEQLNALSKLQKEHHLCISATKKDSLYPLLEAIESTLFDAAEENQTNLFSESSTALNKQPS